MLLNSIQAYGQSIKIPKDLYIPPDALEVFLEAFSGPFDLLLYLVKKNNINILDISLTSLTSQYIEYIELLKNHKTDAALDYLVMAAWLLEAKSKLLLPNNDEKNTEDDFDPKIKLQEMLLNYLVIKKEAQLLESLPRVGEDTFLIHVSCDNVIQEQQYKFIKTVQLQKIFNDLLLKQLKKEQTHSIKTDDISVAEKMNFLLSKLSNSWQEWGDLLVFKEGKLGIVVSFIAILELQKQNLIKLSIDTESTILFIKLS